MNCQTLLLISYQTTSKNGSTGVFSQSEYLTHQAFLEKKESLERLSSTKDIKIFLNKSQGDDLFFDSGTIRFQRLVSMYTEKGIDYMVDYINQCGDPLDSNGERLSYLCYRHLDLRYSFEQLKKLGNPFINKLNKVSLTHAMVSEEKLFLNAEQILELNEPPDDNGNTLAHVYEIVHHLTFDDIVKLKNPSNNKGETLAHKRIIYSKGEIMPFSLAQLIELGNPSNRDGNTLAHVAAEYCKTIFSDEQIEMLGNPINNKGHSIKNVMDFITDYFGHYMERVKIEDQ